jgi:UDPglucose--hexose-1-phosphate uridylyltransferase
MRTLRQDVVSGRLVMIATARATRPHTLVSASQEPDGELPICPFCPGHEDMTPPEIMRTEDGSADGSWRTRVFPNLYPLSDVHEVVVLAPDHRSFPQLTDDEAVEVMLILRDRVRTHLEHGLPYAVAFINHRRAAGASIAHPHAQVVALDFVPPEVTAMQERQRRSEGDLVARDIASAREHELVLRSDDVVAWCPYGSSASFQVRIAHNAAGPHFDDADDDVVGTVARAMRGILARMHDTLADPPYNAVIHTADRASSVWPRWHVEITPRLGITAGFEQATGVFVNTVPPETAATDLR